MERRLNIVVVLVLVFVAWQARAQVTCTASGRYPDPTDTTCQNYTLCYLSADSTYLAYNYSCPSITVFDPTTGQCTSPTTYTCNVTLPLCTANGYFPDPNSSNCSSYIICVDSYGNGTYDEFTLNCPEGGFYNPNTTFCEPGYTCTSTPAQLPTSTTTAPVPVTTTTLATTTTTVTPTTTTVIPTTIGTTTPAPTFTCSLVGRFANTTDTTCQRYYNCVVAPNGTFAQYGYICPTTSVFSPITRVCTTNYICPSL